MQQYTRSLVVEEMGLGTIIEKSFRLMEEGKLNKEANNGAEDDDEYYEERLFAAPVEEEATTQDILDFLDLEESEREQDEYEQGLEEALKAQMELGSKKSFRIMNR